MLLRVFIDKKKSRILLIIIRNIIMKKINLYKKVLKDKRFNLRTKSDEFP